MVILGFSPDSRIGHLYEDVRKAYLATGKNEAQFILDINVGYTVSYPYFPVSRNDTNVIEAQEVVEMAYRFGEFHVFLARHGFPTPIGMNDYNPQTKIDDQLRGEIKESVRKFSEEIVRQRGFNPGTADHAQTLARRIFDWQLQRMPGYADCEIEPPDWQALSEGCGACTERTAILYYALKEANLNPQFFLIFEHEPTISNFSRFGEYDRNSGGQYHVCVGILIPGKKDFLHIDTSQKLFDAKYPYAMIMTPGQFVVTASIGNQLNDLFRSPSPSNLAAAVTAADVCLELDEDNATCNEGRLLAGLFRPRRASGFTDEKLERIPRKIASTQLESDPALALCGISLALLDGFASGDVSRITRLMNFSISALRVLARKDKRQGSLIAIKVAIAIQMAVSKLPSIELKPGNPIGRDELAQQLNELTYNVLASAIENNPRLLLAYGIFDSLLEKHGQYEKGWNFFRGFAERHPDISLACYFRASYGLEYLEHAELKPAESASILDQVAQDIATLEGLEPGNVRTTGLKGKLAAMRGDIDGAIRIFESVRGRHGENGTLSFWPYSMLITLYLSKGDIRRAEDAVAEVFQLDFKRGREGMATFLWGVLVENFNPVLSGESGSHSVAVDARDNSVIAAIERMVDKIAENSDLLPRARQLYAVLFIRYFMLSAGSNTEDVQRLARKVGAEPSREVTEAAELWLARLAQFFNSLNTDRLRIKDPKWKELAAVLESGEIGRILGVQLDSETAIKLRLCHVKRAIATNDMTQAASVIKKTKASRATASMYQDMVVGHFYSEMCAEPKSREKIRMALDVVEISLHFNGPEAQTLFTTEKAIIDFILEKSVEAGFVAEASRARKLARKLAQKI